MRSYFLCPGHLHDATEAFLEAAASAAVHFTNCFTRWCRVPSCRLRWSSPNLTQTTVSPASGLRSRTVEHCGGTQQKEDEERVTVLATPRFKMAVVPAVTLAGVRSATRQVLSGPSDRWTSSLGTPAEASHEGGLAPVDEPRSRQPSNSRIGVWTLRACGLCSGVLPSLPMSHLFIRYAANSTNQHRILASAGTLTLQRTLQGSGQAGKQVPLCAQ